MNDTRERIDFDVLFVGGGPAALAGAVHLASLSKKRGLSLEIALIEKGGEIGAHAVSGAVLNPKALAELIPDYLNKGCPLEGTVSGDALHYLTSTRSYRLPATPKDMRNHGSHIISLSKFTKWLGDMAEALEINVFPGFTGAEVLFSDDGKTVIGVRTGDKGLSKDGAPGPSFEPGIDLMSRITVFAEGARGSLTKSLREKLNLDAGKTTEVFEVGVKEVIQLPEDNDFCDGSGKDYHFMGYPLNLSVPGGGFLYEMKQNRVGLGFLTGLGYDDPHFDPYEAFIQFKRHPFIMDIIKNGNVIEQGARTVSSGGYYSMPRLYAAGGLIIGGGGGIQNMPALKGIHLSMKSGMLAAETIIEALGKEDTSATALSGYQDRFEKSWAGKEMWACRNFSQALAGKGPMKWIHLGAQYVTGGKGLKDPMEHTADALTFKPAKGSKPGKIDPSLLDETLYVDKLTGVFLGKIMHREDQPSHIVVHDKAVCIEKCLPLYDCPCTRFCPGEVYEIVPDESTGEKTLKLNPSNCFHCKTCDIKDPFGNISWTCPEGGDGPAYTVV